MILSDISVTRPVLATVISLVLVVFGFIAFDQLALREYPDIDPPIVSIRTDYPGAAANVVETKITQIIEDRIAGVEGIKYIQSSSEDGRSNISIEFNIDRDIDGATNDIRDRVSTVLNNLPEEADPPEIEKVDSNDDVIVWLNLVSDRLDVLELTDYARRYLQDRFSVLDGVARVRIGGGLDYSVRIWLDRVKLASIGLTANDIEDKLRAENIELPAGSIESIEREFTARVKRAYLTIEDFKSLIIKRGKSGYLVRLSDVARVEKAAVEDRTFFRGNGVPMVGIGIIKQSRANTLAVAQAATAEAKRLNPTLPDGMQILESYDTSIFIKDAINEVYKTLFIAITLVILVIYLFLGSGRAMIIPALTVPISLIATFIMLNAFGFSINLLTLLALVLAIGLVVDDGIVVLENIHRRIEEGETALVAAFKGSRQVGFAVVATTLVLIAVFVPISFLQGNLGRLFSEFALTMAAAVGFSTLVALTLCPMLASKLLTVNKHNRFSVKIDNFFAKVQSIYGSALVYLLKVPVIITGIFFAVLFFAIVLFNFIPSEYAPKEDRGAFFLIVNGPEGASYHYMKSYMETIEDRLMPLVDNNEIDRLLVRAPRQFGLIETFNTGIVIVVLDLWSKRRSAWEIMSDVRGRLADLPGISAFPVMRQGFGGGISKPVQFVIGGGTYTQLTEWRNILLEKINENNPGLIGLDYDYKESKPQLQINIDRDRAGDLGISVRNIGRTLETMLGSRRVTTYIDEGEEYDVIIEGERDSQRTATNLENIYVSSELTNELIPLSNLVKLTEFADASKLNRYNRVRAITLDANLAEGYALGEALTYLENLVKEYLPETVIIDYKGESLDLKRSSDSILFIFAMGIIVVFLVLAAQFESFRHPLIIMLTVPLAVCGALFGLYMTGNTLNIYTQVGLIMLIGLAAKNGILIVEFINQLRNAGTAFKEAVIQASQIRLRPIIMTGITTAAGSLPLIFSSGAGAETRFSVGIVILFGTIAATFFTLFIIPAAYYLLARNTGSPDDVKNQLNKELDHMDNVT